ncbi:MAG: ABC transporter permease [Blastocatellia bacterium]
MGPAGLGHREGEAGDLRSGQMKWLNIFVARLHALVRREAVIEDIEEEMRAHVEMETESLIERGMRPEEARRAALKSFGNLGRMKELAYDVRGGGMLETLWQDLRFGARMLLKHPGFTLIAALTLALGIGANTAIFSVVNSLLLRPLPFSEPDKLVQIWEANVKRGRSEMPASFPNFADWRDQNHVFEQVVAYTDGSFNLTGTGESERIRSALVSPAFFSTLGINPILGRVFLPEEDKKNKVFSVVMGQRLWQRRFDSDPNIVGKSINLNGDSFTVVGVIAQNAHLPLLPVDIELWVPVSHGFSFTERGAHYLQVLARLKLEVTIQQAQSEMDSIANSLAEHYPDSNTNFGIRLVPLQQQIVGDFKTALLVLLGAVVFVLLIASANVANMLLARAATRQKEIAIRMALGAGRARLIRQLLTESMLLAFAGGLVGLLLALWGIDLLVAFSPFDIPRVKEVAIDGRVLGFTLGVSILTGIIFGFAPALQASRPDLNETLKEGGRSASGGIGRQRVRSLLVVAEIALSLVLLVGAGLLMRSFIKLQSVNPGFDSRNVLTMQLDLSGPNYKTGTQVIAFHNLLLERIKALPGIESASTRSYTPVASDAPFAYLSFAIEGVPIDIANRSVAYYNAVSTDYFQTMGIPVLKGRQFDEHDVRKAQNVAMVNETAARRFFPDEDPIGKRVSFNDENPTEQDWATIIGVVKDTKPRALDGESVAEMYMPYDQQPELGMSLMIRTTNKPETMASAVRSELQALDGNQPVYSIRTLDSVLSESVATPRFRTFLLGAFAAVALILAVVGIYGVISYSVAQRTHEIGIRMALGAEARNIFKLVIGQGMLLTAIGVMIGLTGSFALMRFLSSLLFGVSATDTITFASITALLSLVALLACYVPARRATKVDPMIALRTE